MVKTSNNSSHRHQSLDRQITLPFRTARKDIMSNHFSENAELAVGATSAIVAADQLLQATDPDEDKASHLVKAGIGAAIAIGAFELLRRQNEKDRGERGSQERRPRQLRRSGSYERSLSRSPTPSRSRTRSAPRSGSRSEDRSRSRS